MIPDINIETNRITHPLLSKKGINLQIARLDKIHPIVSGNKLFKLYYFLEEAIQSKSKTIITFGGAYSNHLVATAFACREYGIRCIGIVRGEPPSNEGHTLEHCKSYGMQIEFVSRIMYPDLQNEAYSEILTAKFGPHTLIPEGGYHPTGAKGATKIATILNNHKPDYLCTPLGTGVTLAGLISGCDPAIHIISVPALKGIQDIPDRLKYLTGSDQSGKYEIFDDFHFGGYAKKNDRLINFMNDLYQTNNIPTDFVYTSKMMFGIFEKIGNDFFTPGSKILCLHTGGLQGNLSLPAGTLKF